MSDEHVHQSSRISVILVLLAVGGSAVGVVSWHLLSNRSAGLDTSGFDMSTTPDPANSAAPPSFRSAPLSAPAPVQQTSLGMVKGDAGMRVVGPGTSGTSGSSDAGKKPANPKESAAMSAKEIALKNEKFADAFVRRMEKKHPSITKYGKDWAASPELRALRDQYWKEKDPLKFAYGLAKSNDFGKLVKKYAADPAVRDFLITGIKEAPPSVLSALGGISQNDKVVKGLVNTVLTAVGLPASLTGFLDGSDTKAPDQNQVMSDILKSGMQNQQQTPAVALPEKEAEQSQPNGFRPLGSKR